MPEGSPADTPPAEAGNSSADADEQTPQPQSVEEVEAIWKNRVSQKDKAHAAETKALRDQIAAFERQSRQKTEADSADSSEAEQWKAKYEEAAKAAEDERRQHLIEVRSAKYPAAAEALDEASLASMDEGKLAGLQARLSEEGEAPATGTIDPNAAPRRAPTPPKSQSDKTVEELQHDLEQQAPAFIESLNS